MPLDRLRSDVIAALLYVTNWWYIVDGQNYFESLGRPPVLQHLWSLAVEEQWYLIWPLPSCSPCGAVGGAVHRLVVPLLAVAAASAVWMAILFGATGDISRVYYGTDTHLSGLLIGAAAAMCWRPWRSRTAGQRHLVLVDAAGATALVLLVLTMLQWGSDTTFLYRGGFVVVALLSIVVVAAAVHPGRPAPRRLPVHPAPALDRDALVRHLPVALARGRPPRRRDVGWPRPAMVLLWTVLTVGLAELSYRLVESPIRHGALTRWYQRLRTAEGPDRSVLWSRAQLAGLAVVFVVGGLGVRLANAEKVDIAVGGTEQALAVPPRLPRPPAPGVPRPCPSPSPVTWRWSATPRPPPSCATHRPGSAST